MKCTVLNCRTVVLMVGLLLCARHVEGGMLGWWRMGDEDSPAPVDGGQIPGTGVVNHYGNTSPAIGPFTPHTSSGDNLYSLSAPGPFIYDPIGDTTAANAWSYNALDVGDPNNEGRIRVQNVTIPTVFTFEAFVYFNNVALSANAPEGFDFAYNQSNHDGGWGISLNDDNHTLEGRIATYDGSDVKTIVHLYGTTVIQDDTWYHVALVFDGNSGDGSDDAHLYVNYAEEASVNVPDGNTYQDSTGDGVTTFYLGAVLEDRQVILDEARYFSDVKGPSDFLVAVPEPGAFCLLSIGLAGICCLKLRRR